MKRFFPLKGKGLLVFRTGIIVLVCAAAYISILGRHYVLPAIRSWLMDLSLIPAILILLVIVALLFAVMGTALYLVTGGENLFLRLVRRLKKYLTAIKSR